MRGNILVWRSFLLIIILSFAAGCSDTSTPVPADEDIAQKYLFDAYHVNFSWGYTLAGTYIDNQGNVITYDHSFEVWTAADFDSLTVAELDEKFIAPVDTVGHVDQETLRDMFELIESASEGELSGRVFMGPDMGGSTRICYKYDEETDRYIKVLLSLNGSYRQSNLSEAAIELDAWLSTVLTSP